jgi:hypothetical protein
MHQNAKNPTEKQSGAQENAGGPGDNRGGVKTKTRTRAWLWWMCTAGLLLFLAQYVEGFNSHLIVPSLLFVFLAFAASARSFWIQYTTNNGSRFDGYVRAACIVFVGVASSAGLLWWHYGHTQPKPHVTLSLQVQGAPPLPLTNDCLFRVGMLNVLHRTNGFLFFNGVAGGCVVVPVHVGETNKIFSFIAENDSPVKIADLALIVGFPDSSQIALDPSKWHEVGTHLFVPGYKLQLTNIHSWAAQSPSPWPLYFSDSVAFPPITNCSLPAFNHPTNRIDFLHIIMRANGFEQLMSANVLFVRLSSNQTFKPFVTTMHQETNGTWHISPSPAEFEASQR